MVQPLLVKPASTSPVQGSVKMPAMPGSSRTNSGSRGRPAVQPIKVRGRSRGTPSPPVGSRKGTGSNPSKHRGTTERPFSPLELEGDANTRSPVQSSAQPRLPSAATTPRYSNNHPTSRISPTRYNSSNDKPYPPRSTTAYTSKPQVPFMVHPNPRRGEPVDAAVWEKVDNYYTERSFAVQQPSVVHAHVPVMTPRSPSHVRQKEEEESGGGEGELVELSMQLARLRSSFDEMKKQDEVRALKSEIQVLKSAFTHQSQPMQPLPSAFNSVHSPQQQMLMAQPVPVQPLQISQQPMQIAQPLQSTQMQPVQMSHLQQHPPSYAHPQTPIMSAPVMTSTRSVGSTPEIVAVEQTPLGTAWFNNIPEAAQDPVQITVQKF